MKGGIMDLIKENKKYFILGLLGLIVAGVSFYFYYGEESFEESKVEEESILFENNDNKEVTTISEKFYVDVKGAVKKPGVYEFTDGEKVVDAIEKAGGLKSGATTSNINLSKKLTSEMVIYIFTSKELTTTVKATTTTTAAACVCETIKVDNCINETDETAAIDDNNNDGNNNDKVNINTASIEELVKINGIGNSKAESIIKYRNENGSFSAIEDIKNVSGLGDAIFNKIKDYITV